MTDLDSLIADFYAPPNEIDFDTLNGSAGDLVGVLLSRFQERRRTLLPAGVNGVTRWYGFAPSGREARLLLEEMRAWLGPPLAGSVSVVGSLSDEVDRAAQKLTSGELLLRADVVAGWKKEARENVHSLVDLWAITPKRSTDIPRPVGRVLREFYESVSARDRVSADSAIEEIRAGALLSATNVLFLRVELIGSLGNAAELRDDPALRGITLIHRPPKVTEHLVKAADDLFVAPYLDGGAEARWGDIAAQIEDAWPGLISHTSQVLSVSGARCLALTEALTTHPRQVVYDTLSASWEDDPVVRAMADAAQTGPPSTGPTTAIDLYHRGEYDLLLDFTEAADPDLNAAVVALHGALNLGDALSAARAIALVDRLGDDDRKALLAKAVERSFYKQLQERNAGNNIPEGWRDWLTGEWPDRPDLLNAWSANWDRQVLSSTEWGDALAVELLDALHDERRGRTRNGLPALVEWLHAPDGLQPGGVPLAVTIFDIMLGSDPGRVERQASLQLLDEILSVGCSAKEYAAAIAALSDQITRVGPREVQWVIGVLDLLLFSATPDSSKRDELISETLKVANSWYGRHERTDAVLLSRLFADAGHEYASPPPGGESEEPRRIERSFDRVGIYSLSESAAQNAGRWIQEEWPEAKVRLSHAHSNSSALEGFVRSSDVVLVQTSHAKHAATDAISAASADHSRLVLVHGRGATSLFRGLLNWVSGDG